MLKINFPLEKKFSCSDTIKFDIPFCNNSQKKVEKIILLPNYIYFLHGTNGVGKTTLLNIISFLTKFNKGFAFENNCITIGTHNNHNILSKEQIRKEYFSYIFQDPHVINIYTIEENLKILNEYFDLDTDLEFVIRDIKNLTNISSENQKYIIEKISKIQHEKNNSPYYLSGGEKQLLSFMRAMIKPSHVIFADEPWAAMDIKLKEFVESQLYDYLTNKDIFHKYRQYLETNDNNTKNLVFAITHEFHHLYNSKKYGIIDDNFSLKIPIIKNRTNHVNIFLSRYNKILD